MFVHFVLFLMLCLVDVYYVLWKELPTKELPLHNPRVVYTTPPPPSIKTFKGAPRVWKFGFCLGGIEKMLIKICRSGVGQRPWNLGFCLAGIKQKSEWDVFFGVGRIPGIMGLAWRALRKR